MKKTAQAKIEALQFMRLKSKTPLPSIILSADVFSNKKIVDGKGLRII